MFKGVVFHRLKIGHRALSIMTLAITTFSITTFSIMTLSGKGSTEELRLYLNQGTLTKGEGSQWLASSLK
jgi:hypothetical protein